MINILFALNGVFNKGGTEAVVLNIFDNINKNKFHIDFLVHGSHADNDLHKYLENAGSSIFYVTPRGISYRQNTNDITEVLSKHHFDIVHSHMDAAGYFLMRIAKKLGIKTRIAHSHNTASPFPSILSVHSFVHRIALEYARIKLRTEATHFIACSEAAGKWLFGVNICKSDRYMLLKNGIDVANFLYNVSIRDKTRDKLRISRHFVIGHVGRFAAQKNHQFLINVFKEIYKRYPIAKLMLVGNGELLDNVKRQITKIELPEDSVIFTGTRSDVNALYQAMDVMVLPSLFEGLPVVMVEAQASGVKVIASDNITNESMLIPETEFLSLNDGVAIWANEILKYINGYTRRNTYKEIKNAGYSAKDNITGLENFYIKALNQTK
ncbi:glycosyltransferase family 1 protein [uncultured Cloacibacillus sp.]|uniref:glycosyltransferase family 1 protein n=1 Tax=uncultured Cloacibacillus sp. TaxID=889794 RepID=UPI00258E74AE|nr:glycosyltransferase family 1 protein [uncultured Cloacibacillus sp.]